MNNFMFGGDDDDEENSHDPPITANDLKRQMRQQTKPQKRYR